MNSFAWLKQKPEGKKGKSASSKNKQRDHRADANGKGQNSQLVTTDSLRVKRPQLVGWVLGGGVRIY